MTPNDLEHKEYNRPNLNARIFICILNIFRFCYDCR